MLGGHQEFVGFSGRSVVERQIQMLRCISVQKCFSVQLKLDGFCRPAEFLPVGFAEAFDDPLAGRRICEICVGRLHCNFFFLQNLPESLGDRRR